MQTFVILQTLAEVRAASGRFFMIWEIAANQPRVQTLEPFQTLAEVRVALGRFQPLNITLTVKMPSSWLNVLAPPFFSQMRRTD